jgi:signal transduction histidine kinase
MKFLHLEDDAGDAALIRNIVSLEWPDCEITLCHGRADFQAALEQNLFDVILSDHTLIAFNGIEALNLAQRLAPETPFIMLSGTIDEELAIGAIRAGAADYILKDRMGRLKTAIHRALGQTEERQQRKALEEKIVRAQRMENIGLLAAGIAHDLNNVLAPMILIAPLLRERVTDPEDLNLLVLLEKSAVRGARLVRQILEFARGTARQHQPTQARHLLHEIGALTMETFPRNIRMEQEIAGDLWPIQADATQIHQVVFNLCVNARDAMPDGGTLRLSAINCVLDEHQAAVIDGARPGAFVAVGISDTGSGIGPEILPHIWEPFFTTKEPGKGTGLGLATVRGIIESHRGFIDLATAVGRGTAFRIYLPATNLTTNEDQPNFPAPLQNQRSA